jgi:plastocyanin
MRHHTARLRWGALALAVLLALSTSACGDDDGDGDDTASGSDQTTETTASDADAGTTEGGGAYGDEGGSDDDDSTTTAAAGGGAGAVTVAGFEFTPGEVEVAVGDEVTWSNEDDTTHTVTADDGSFDHSLDGAGTSAAQTFDEAGEYAYHCEIHASMQGTVVVTEG